MTRFLVAFSTFFQRLVLLSSFFFGFSGPKPREYVVPSDLTGIPKEDLFYPVQCSVCSLNVGVFDHDEVYHFFDVLTGYA